VDWHDDGSITFRCKVDGLDEIVWWVLSMGPHCTVVHPKELADRVCQLAEQTLQRYRKA
jgi:predicted DNA-binding transcriptional regulator YafY